MIPRPARILFVGDVHLGRRPLHLPEGLDPGDLDPAAAWLRTVEEALAVPADAVVLAGDVVESLEDRWEAFHHLEEGVRRLVAAGVPVLGVAGNHDVVALPRLAAHLPDFRLVGRDGLWEVVTVGTDGVQPWRLVGRSFPRGMASGNPMASWQSPDPSGPPLLGVLHCDLDADPGRSSYAPVARAELERTGLPWFLGHVHAPGDLAAPPHIGYLGSVSPLDRTETGAHGPWLVEVGPAGVQGVRQLALAPLRYERVVVDATRLEVGEGDDAVAVLENAADEALDDCRARVAASSAEARAVGCTVVLAGAHPASARLREALAGLQAEAVGTWCKGQAPAVFLAALRDELRPARDLVALAAGSEPPALLARRLQELASGSEAARTLVEAFRQRVRGRLRGREWQDALAEGGEAALLAALVEGGRQALEALLAQRAGEESRA